MPLLQDSHRPRSLAVPNWWEHYNLLWLVLITSVILSVWLWLFTKQHHQSRAEERFASLAKAQQNSILYRIQLYRQFLNDGVGLFNASKSVSRQEWHDFVAHARLNENLPGVLNMAVSFPISASELARHQASVRAQGYPDYQIKPVQPQREIYYSLLYVAPENSANLNSLGYDMMTSASRKDAIERAIFQDQISASAAVMLVQDQNTWVQPGFIFCAAVYDRSKPIDTAAERQSALKAIITAAIRVQELMQGIVDATSHVGLEIYDDGIASHAKRIYYSDLPQTEPDPRFVQSTTIDLGGQFWLLKFHARPAFFEADSSIENQVVAIALILFNCSLLLITVKSTQRERDALLSGQSRQNWFNTVMDNTQNYVHIRDLEGRYVFVNKAYERVFSCKNEQIQGKHFSEVVSPELAQILHQVESELITSGQAISTENVLMVNGKKFTYLVNRSPLFDAHGKIVGTCGVGADISEIKRLEAEMENAISRLRESEERWAFAIEGSGDGVWDWDILNTRVKFSKRWKEMLGYRDDEVGEELSEWYSRVHPEDMPKVIADLNLHFAGDTQLYLNEHRVLGKDGHYIWILDRGMVVKRDEANKPLRMVGTHTDISTRKEMERIKAEFISTVSHELRTPVTSIRGALGLIEAGACGEVAPKALDLIKIAHRNCQRLIVLVNDILDMEKLLSGKMTLQCSSWNVFDMIVQCIDENSAYAAGFSVTYELTQGHQTAMVYADMERSKQVLTNLLSNAAKFSPAGAVVTISVEHQSDCIKVLVRDQGIGIPKDFQSRLFEAFSQADSSNTRRQGSTGLGLHISKRMIEKMQGNIGFSSVENQGSVFFFTLPKAAD